MQYECAQCGRMARFWRESAPFTAPCPNCEERTSWTQAFEADSGGVVEF